MKLNDLSLAVRVKLIKTTGRCKALSSTVILLRDLYIEKNTTEDQRNFIETIIGAGIWYIDSKGLATNKVSLGVLKDFHPESGIMKPRYTEDHEYPRKIAARELLQKDWSNVKDASVELFELYLTKYGKVNYVTSTENKVITKYQRAGIFETPEIAYKEAGITLVVLSEDELSRMKSRDKEFIEKKMKSI